MSLPAGPIVLTCRVKTSSCPVLNFTSGSEPRASEVFSESNTDPRKSRRVSAA